MRALDASAADAAEKKPSSCRTDPRRGQAKDRPLSATGYRVRVADGGGTWYLGPGCHDIGRSRSCCIHIDHATVSRHHVEIEILAEGGVVVRDLDSTNGSWLGDRRIQRAAVAGDFDLRVGAIELEFDLQRGVPDARTAKDAISEEDMPMASTPTGATAAMEQMR